MDSDAFLRNDELIRIRFADGEAADDAARQALNASNVVPGAERRFGRVVITAGVPYSPACFYKVAEVALTGPEVEGGAGTETLTGATYIAFNLAATVPANNQKVTITGVPHRWVFGG